MGGSVDESLEDVAEHFESWLASGMAGCHFAAAIASGRPLERMSTTAYKEPLRPETLARVLASDAGNLRSSAVVYPSIVSETELVAYLQRLEAGGDRWELKQHLHPDGRLHVGVGWRTDDGLLCELMGFAPLPTMPVTRRAPYVALAGWAGGRLNDFKPFPYAGDVVGFIDAAHGMSKKTHEALWAKTRKTVGQLMALPPDDAARFHHVAFALSPDSSW